jgi:glycine dehydrogenase
MYLSPVRRIDQAYGDRNLVCSCPPPEAFADAETDGHTAHGGTGKIAAPTA